MTTLQLHNHTSLTNLTTGNHLPTPRDHHLTLPMDAFGSRSYPSLAPPQISLYTNVKVCIHRSITFLYQQQPPCYTTKVLLSLHFRLACTRVFILGRPKVTNASASLISIPQLPFPKVILMVPVMLI